MHYNNERKPSAFPRGVILWPARAPTDKTMGKRARLLSRTCTVNLAGIVMTHLRNEMIFRDEASFPAARCRHRRSLHFAFNLQSMRVAATRCAVMVDRRFGRHGTFSVLYVRAAAVTFVRVNAYRVTSIMLNLI